MKWTNNKPCETGYYWLAILDPFSKKYSVPMLFKVEETVDGNYKVLTFGNIWYGLSAWGKDSDKWYGPIGISCPPLIEEKIIEKVEIIEERVE